jgi:hypothetical protein
MKHNPSTYQTELTFFVHSLLRRLHLDRNVKDIVRLCKTYILEKVEQIRWWVPGLMQYMLGLWIRVMLYFYFIIPSTLFSMFMKLIKGVVRYCTIKSVAAHKLVVHIEAIWEIMENIFHTLMAVNVSVLLLEIIQAIGNMIVAYLNQYGVEGGPFGGNNAEFGDSPFTFGELNQLIFYEEISDEEQGKMNGWRGQADDIQNGKIH